MAVDLETALPRAAVAAQAQVRRLRLRPRVRRGAGQGRRRHRHREGLEPLRRRQRRRRRPRTPELLAGDLDDETLVRYIDRFLMFYIRTADRLQRTAPWLESLEGGLDHLRAVVCDDSPRHRRRARGRDGHATSTGYHDEWAGVLDDPEKLSRFVSFVNAPEEPDPTVAFDESRPPQGARSCWACRPRTDPTDTR